jgi:hypothetical protein
VRGHLSVLGGTPRPLVIPMGTRRFLLLCHGATARGGAPNTDQGAVGSSGSS